MASQVNHFKEFATVADYEAYIQPDDYAKPLVALVEATGTVMFPQGGGGGGGDCGNPMLKTVDVEDFTGETLEKVVRYITEAVIPDGVTTIDDSAFSACERLTSVTIPDGVTSINYNAFNSCFMLPSIDIPSTVTSIGRQAFYFCRALTRVTVRATTPPTLGTNVFFNTPYDMVIYVPAESVQAYKTASGWSDYASQIQAIP